MTKISSGLTFWRKRVLPVLWFAIMLSTLAIGAFSGAFARSPVAIVLAIVVQALAWFVIGKLVRDLADEVYDCGDSLLVRNRGATARIPLSNVSGVSASTATNPPRITLKLASPSRFGSEIVFSPVVRGRSRIERNAIANDLIARVDNARVRRAR